MASTPPFRCHPSAISRGEVVSPMSNGDRSVVRLRGEHDITTEVLVSDVMADAIAGDDADPLVVDLSDVGFMDASTIGVIIRAQDLLRVRSRSLSVQDPSRCARRVLDLCGLAGLIGTEPAHSGRPG